MTIKYCNCIPFDACQLNFGVAIFTGFIRYLHINENSSLQSILLLPVPKESVIGFEGRGQHKKGQRNSGHFEQIAEHVIKLS